MTVKAVHFSNLWSCLNPPEHPAGITEAFWLLPLFPGPFKSNPRTVPALAPCKDAPFSKLQNAPSQQSKAQNMVALEDTCRWSSSSSSSSSTKKASRQNIRDEPMNNDKESTEGAVQRDWHEPKASSEWASSPQSSNCNNSLQKNKETVWQCNQATDTQLVPRPPDSSSTIIVFRCGQCNKTFSQRSALQIHVCPRLAHNPFKCGYCSKAFAQSNELRAHAIIHASEKPFKCGFCARAFAGATTLNNHIRTHTGERPFTCEKCDKTFSQASQLSRHKRFAENCFEWDRWYEFLLWYVLLLQLIETRIHKVSTSNRYKSLNGDAR